MEAIKNLIENGELDAAKEKIKEIEMKLSEESSIYEQGILKRQLESLKNLYSSKINLDIPTTRESSNEYVNEINFEFDGSKDCPIVRNLNHKKISAISCKNILIENCTFVATERITCESTISIKNVYNSELECSSSHLRISNSSSLILKIFCKTGVFLQNCKDIKISAIDEPNNKYFNVFDFNEPWEIKNYKLI